MTRRRVLFLSYAFPPLAAPESWLAAKAVHSLAHVDVDVHVVSATPRWWHSKDESLVAWAHGAAAAVDQVRTPQWLPLVQPVHALRQFPDAMRLLEPRARRLMTALDPSAFDAMVTWSQWHSAHLVGLRIKRKHPGLRWLAHLSDPWVDNPLQPRHALGRFLNRRWESTVFQLADVVEFTSPATLRHAVNRHTWLEGKAHALPHAFDEDLYAGAPGSHGPILVRHVGSFYGGRTPAPLFDGLLSLAPDLNDVRVELIGNVPQAMRAHDALAQLPHGVLDLLSSVPYLTSLRLMRQADVLVLVDAPASESLFVPSKLVDYLGAQRPIVAITPPGAAAAIVRDAGGWVADPSDPAAVREALKAALDHARAHRGAGWGAERVRSRYAAPALGRRRLDLLFPHSG